MGLQVEEEVTVEVAVWNAGRLGAVGSDAKPASHVEEAGRRDP